MESLQCFNKSYITHCTENKRFLTIKEISLKLEQMNIKYLLLPEECSFK